ncbi:MAG: endonuclease MutS2 [Fusobacteriota bacterium]
MNQHSLKVLEFDKVKDRLSNYAHAEKTIEMIIDLEPITDYNKIVREFNIIRDYIDLLRYDSDKDIDLKGIKDVENAIDRIQLIGTFLEPEELYQIKENLRIFREIQDVFEEVKEKYGSLNKKYENIPKYKGIENLINKAIDENHEIKDDATLELQNIRKNKVLIMKNIQRKFEGIMANEKYNKMIQEKLITIKNGRRVLPIKSGYKDKFKGIEHDRSGSGQTIFIEPIDVVSLNNKLRTQEVKEREEIRKILLRLTDTIRNNTKNLKNLTQEIIKLDLMNAKARYSIENNCNIPKVTNKKELSLKDARHPLIPEDEVVPISFELGKRFDTMLVTGPNTGGKTVTLKTTGLLTAMTQAMIPIPADELTVIGVFSGIFADIGDEQSIEQNLSSFSSHLANVDEIINEIDRDSLILLDELGSGTDPIEGAAFAMAVIDYLRKKGPKSIITTHYSEVKAYSYNEKGVKSASMEFDVETLSPTYRLIIGIPGKSNALTIARKVGMNEEIVTMAEGYISDEDKKVEDMIKNIHEKQEEINKDKARISRLEKQVEKLKTEYGNKLDKIEKEKNDILKKAYQEAEEVVKNAQGKARALVDKIDKQEKKKEDAKKTQKSLNMLQQGILEDKKKRVKKEKKQKLRRDLEEGEEVFVKSLNSKGEILRINNKKRQVQVQAGILKMMVDMKDVKKINSKNEKKSTGSYSVKKNRVKSEIDLRGMDSEEAKYEVDIYLDSATLNGYQEVFLIHGKGSGVLRKAIQKHLKNSPYVESFRNGNANEGGLGVTVAKLK